MAAAADVHTFLFADLVDFTALTVTWGDEAAADLAEALRDVAVTLAREHDAELVKGLGDGVMVRGSCPAATVLLGLGLGAGLLGLPWWPRLRVGVHTGSAVARGGDWYGTTVNLAARLTARARGGEVLVTEATGRFLHGSTALELEDRGPCELRGAPAPLRVLAARRAAVPSLAAA